MYKNTVIGIISLLLVPFFSFGQKVKYKDIFTLLNNKQYDDAEPFLRKYMAENDNPNAWLFMGIIYEEKIPKDDILKNTELTYTHLDSGVYFFDKALKSIDDKELKKNKEYYAMYNRRDLRTGEFGVKLSDVQFELEKKISGLKERKDKVKMVKHYFSQAEDLYRRSLELYVSIQKAFPGERELYLRAEDGDIANLKSLSQRFDSCSKAFDNYKISSGNLGKTGYNQKWTLTEIKDFKKDGADIADFYQEELLIWDYKKFADNAVLVVEKELKPVKDNLVKYDVEINKLKEKINTDSVSVKSDLTKLIESMLSEKLKKFDPQPLPLDVFSVKVANLEYRSLLMEHKKLRDSADVNFRLSLVSKEVAGLRNIDSLATQLLARNIDEEALNYQHFVTNTYNNAGLLKSYIKSEKEFAERERKKKDEELSFYTEATKWLVNGTDSIPLFSGLEKSRFKPLLIVDKRYTTGVVFSDSVSGTGYFYNITPNHVPTIKVNFPIDRSNFRQMNLSVIKGIASADAGDQIFFTLIYLDQKVKESYPVTLAKIYRSDGLSWSSNLQLGFLPNDIEFIAESGDLLIKSDDGQVAYVDKNGKLR